MVTGESRSKFGVEGYGPVLRMYLWNETLEYENSTWTTSGIESWALQSVHRVALWMSPSGYKSLSMASFFKHGPVLVFFTPRHMLRESTDAVEMLRQIGMEYYNCHGDEWIREMVRQYLPQQRKEHLEELRRLKGQCQGFAAAARLSSFRKPVSVTFANLLNGSTSQSERQIDDICQLEADSLFASNIKRMRREEEEEGHCSRMSSSCGGAVNKDVPNIRLRETSMLQSAFDRRSPENLAKQQLQRRCELMFIDTEQAASQNSFFLGHKPFTLDQLQGIEAMGCAAGNKSLTMMLMDSSIYHVFAERLGVDILTTKRRSAVAIVDPEVRAIVYLFESQ